MVTVQRSPARRTLITILLAGAGLGLGLAMAALLEHEASTAVRMGLAVVITAAGLGAAVVHWRNLDEAAREAHKWAWYWGSSVGMLAYLCVVGLLLTGAVQAAIPTFDGRTDPLAYVAVGAFGLMAFQVAAYLAAWLGWWLSKR